MEQLFALFHEHAEFAIVYFHIPYVLTRIERRERGIGIGSLGSLIFVLNPILRTPSQDSTSETNQQNNKSEPTE